MVHSFDEMLSGQLTDWYEHCVTMSNTENPYGKMKKIIRIQNMWPDMVN